MGQEKKTQVLKASCSPYHILWISRKSALCTRSLLAGRHMWARHETTLCLPSSTSIEQQSSSHSFPVWQVLAFVQRLLLESKVATQREAYYCLVQHFKNQSEFNDTLQGRWRSITHIFLIEWENFKMEVLAEWLVGRGTQCYFPYRCGSTDRLCSFLSGHLCQ